MRATDKNLQALGLSVLEKKIYPGLMGEPIHISGLAKKSRIARTSLYRPIQALRKRGLIEPVQIGKRTYWKKASSASLLLIARSLLAGASGDDTSATLHPEFFLHSGKEDLMRLYEKLAEKREARVFGIQPNKSAESVLDVFPFKRLVRLNQRIKEQNVIVEGLLQEDFVPFYIETLKKHRLPVEEIFRAFGGRAADTTYVPKQYINFDSEMIILPTSALIFHWSKLVAIEIYNQETIGLLKDLFVLAKSFGYKADQNEMVQGYLMTISDSGHI
jgi:hypothetical protein